MPEKYLVDSQYSTFDLIKIADYIITDYSALSIEASILEKPIFLLMKDLDNYEKSRGLNINLKEELPSFICENFVEIMDKIEKKEYNIKELIYYQKKYIEIDCKNAIENLVDFIIN